MKKSIAWFLETVEAQRAAAMDNDGGGWPRAKGSSPGMNIVATRLNGAVSYSFLARCRNVYTAGGDFWSEMDRLVCRSILSAKHILELYHKKHFGNGKSAGGRRRS